MTLEVCIDSLEGTEVAARNGARRVELCSALSTGGLTPSLALVEKCVQVKGIEVHAMLRHREGDFVYNQSDLEILLRDMELLARAGARGVVFGCLTRENKLDADKNNLLAERARKLGLECTFHRAFDFAEEPKKALEELIDQGFTRILTSGQRRTAIEGIELITELVKQSAGRIQIMAASGVNGSNADELTRTGVDALHFTAHKISGDPRMGMGTHFIPDEEKIARIKMALNE
jgi:copper homeostasis protein